MYEVKYGFGEFGFMMNIYRTEGPGYIWHVAKPLSIVFERLPEDSLGHEPTLKMNHIEGDFFLKALRTSLNAEADGVERLKGKIEVMERYIEDLRKLLRISEKRMIRPDQGEEKAL